MTAAASALLKEQRSDGGWAQLPTLESDAYATGQALYALVESGAMTAERSRVSPWRGFSSEATAIGRLVVRAHTSDPDSAVVRRRIPARSGRVYLRGGNELGSAGTHRRSQRALRSSGWRSSVSKMSPRRQQNREDSGGRQWTNLRRQIGGRAENRSAHRMALR